MLTNTTTDASALDAADDRCLPARAVRERYDVSDMTIWRWLDDESLDFPKPFYIGRLRYWKLSALLEWERRRQDQSRKAG